MRSLNHESRFTAHTAQEVIEAFQDGSARNRRLAPMPARSEPQDLPVPVAPSPTMPAPLQTWHCFAFLVVTAVALYFAKWPINRRRPDRILPRAVLAMRTLPANDACHPDDRARCCRPAGDGARSAAQPTQRASPPSAPLVPRFQGMRDKVEGVSSRGPSILSTSAPRLTRRARRRPAACDAKPN